MKCIGRDRIAEADSRAYCLVDGFDSCDAEPDVLADYIIALLKHDGTEAELSALLNEQLSDFLDDSK